jgi:hypothetical protein
MFHNIMFPNPLARHTTSLKALTSQPITRFVLAGTLFLSLILLLWSSQSPHPKAPWKGGPPSRDQADRGGPLLIYYGLGSSHGSGSHIGEPSSSELRNWKKPEGMKIIGLVFYGRRQFVEVLDCYLKRNLVRNGGIMDEVVFVVHTDIQADLLYLDQIVNGTEGYKKHEQEKKFDGWVGPWELVERGNIYIKIDGEFFGMSETMWHKILQRGNGSFLNCGMKPRTYIECIRFPAIPFGTHKISKCLDVVPLIEPCLKTCAAWFSQDKCEHS